MAPPPSTPSSSVFSLATDTWLSLAQQTLLIEAQALLDMRERMDAGAGASLALAVQYILACKGRVVVMGMGKSGHIGRKIAATLSSTGTPAMFVHPAEAYHGDLGMVMPGDVVLALSNSGESEELTGLLPLLKRQGVPLIAITGQAGSALGQHADVVLDSAVSQEACPLNLAPTASTTAQLALGDVLAVVLLSARGFKAADFARSHPGGTLGRRLLTHVRDVMRQGDAVPAVNPDTAFGDMMREMGAKGLGATAVVDAQRHVVGIFTDGDLRRRIEAGQPLLDTTAGQVMTPHPATISDDQLAAQAAAMMETRRITTLLVVDQQGILVGAINTNDLMRAKVI